MIKEADIYGTHPSNLATHFAMTNKYFQWFFFTWTNRKNPDAKNSTLASRVAGQGRWKSTQCMKLVRNGRGRVIGSKQNFCYMERIAPGKEKKSLWLMEEFSLRTRGGVAISKDQKKLDDWVVCKIYLRPSACKETSCMKVAAVETGKLESPEIENRSFVTPTQDNLNSQPADNVLPLLIIDPSDRETKSSQAHCIFHDSILQHPAPQDMDNCFGSLYHEQLDGAPNEGLDDGPQHNIESLPEILHPFYNVSELLALILLPGLQSILHLHAKLDSSLWYFLL